MSDDPADTVEELGKLLDQERACLLSGDLQTVSELHDRKLSLIDRLNTADAARVESNLPELSKKISRNQVLLDSALDGIKSVSRRLAMIRNVRQSLEFYDEAGSKAKVDINVTRSVEKRA